MRSNDYRRPYAFLMDDDPSSAAFRELDGLGEVDPEARRERQLLLFVTSIGALVFTPLILLMAATRQKEAFEVSLLLLGSFVLLDGACFALAKRGARVWLVSHLFMAGGFGLTVWSVIRFGGVTGPHVAGLPLIAITAMLLRGRWAALSYILASSAFVWLVAAWESSDEWQPRFSATPMASALSVVLYVIGSSVVIWLANRQRKSAQFEAERVAKIARSNQERLEQLIAESPDGLAWFNSKGQLMESNPEFCRLCESSPARLIGSAVGQLRRFESESRMIAVRAMEQLAAGAEQQRFTLRSAGQRPCIVEVRAKRVVLSGVTEAFQWIARDVTERELASEARERLEGELRAARRLEDIGRLAGGVAHDFNNLLTAVNANAYLLDRNSTLSEVARNQVGVIRQAGERAAALTQQLLAFARRQVLEPQPIELLAAVEKLAPLLRQMLGSTVKLELLAGKEEYWVEVDRSRLEQVLTNLAVNGRDAMPAGGTLTVELGREVVQRHTVLPPGPYVVLRVRDTGEGMDEATAERIFEPFFTTKSSGKGTGLGLATVHGIVRQSGGYITVRSSEGAGATFEVYLPEIAAPATSAGGVEGSSPYAALQMGTGTVLVVDDEPLVRQTVVNVLQLAGYRVLAADGPDSVDGILEHEYELDLLVTDVVMPGESGPELAERLQQRWSELKVLFMSGYADEFNTGRWRVVLPFQYLQKPFFPGDLRRVVAELMSGADVGVSRQEG